MKMKILLIDDDKWIRDSLNLFLKSEGYFLVACESGEEGLEKLRDETFNIIIVDYKLPGIDGLDFFKRIKGLHPDSMKILLTAYKENGIIYDATRIGVNEFIQKPFKIKTLQDSLSKFVEKREEKVRNHLLRG